jgi:hypothetical protein
MVHRLSAFHHHRDVSVPRTPFKPQKHRNRPHRQKTLTCILNSPTRMTIEARGSQSRPRTTSGPQETLQNWAESELQRSLTDGWSPLSYSTFSNRREHDLALPCRSCVANFQHPKMSDSVLCWSTMHCFESFILVVIGNGGPTI